MDPETRRIYEDQAEAWIGLRRARAVEDGRVARFAARVQPGGRVADLGSGPGWYASELARLGHPALALDVSLAMLRAGRERPRERVRPDRGRGRPHAAHAGRGPRYQRRP